MTSKKPKATPHEIEQHVMSSLKGDFERAACRARRHLSSLFEKALENPKEAMKKMNYDPDALMAKIENSLPSLDFLVKGSEGLYTPLYVDTPFQGRLYQDYLQAIGRCSHGFGSIPANDWTIEKLIQQNGPKKMEMRLKKFVKSRIATGVKTVLANKT